MDNPILTFWFPMDFTYDECESYQKQVEDEVREIIESDLSPEDRKNQLEVTTYKLPFKIHLQYSSTSNNVAVILTRKSSDDDTVDLNRHSWKIIPSH